MADKLSQDTFQLPAADKSEVTKVAAKLGYFRSGMPSRSRVYQEFVRFALEHITEFIAWREARVRAQFKGGSSAK